jgi:hypothetical protein
MVIMRIMILLSVFCLQVSNGMDMMSVEEEARWVALKEEEQQEINQILNNELKALSNECSADLKKIKENTHRNKEILEQAISKETQSKTRFGQGVAQATQQNNETLRNIEVQRQQLNNLRNAGTNTKSQNKEPIGSPLEKKEERSNLDNSDTPNKNAKSFICLLAAAGLGYLLFNAAKTGITQTKFCCMLMSAFIIFCSKR